MCVFMIFFISNWLDSNVFFWFSFHFAAIRDAQLFRQLCVSVQQTKCNNVSINKRSIFVSTKFTQNSNVGNPICCLSDFFGQFFALDKINKSIVRLPLYISVDILCESMQTNKIPSTTMNDDYCEPSSYLLCSFAHVCACACVMPNAVHCVR